MKKSKYNIMIEQRALELGTRFVLCKDATVRSIAKEACISKSTVHKDFKDRLKNIDLSLYNEVCKKLEVNKNERHIRGGEATKQKYLTK